MVTSTLMIKKNKIRSGLQFRLLTDTLDQTRAFQTVTGSSFYFIHLKLSAAAAHKQFPHCRIISHYLIFSYSMSTTNKPAENRIKFRLYICNFPSLRASVFFLIKGIPLQLCVQSRETVQTGSVHSLFSKRISFFKVQREGQNRKTMLGMTATSWMFETSSAVWIRRLYMGCLVSLPFLFRSTACKIRGRILIKYRSVESRRWVLDGVMKQGHMGSLKRWRVNEI